MLFMGIRFMVKIMEIMGSNLHYDEHQIEEGSKNKGKHIIVVSIDKLEPKLMKTSIIQNN